MCYLKLTLENDDSDIDEEIVFTSTKHSVDCVWEDHHLQPLFALLPVCLHILVVVC